MDAASDAAASRPNGEKRPALVLTRHLPAPVMERLRRDYALRVHDEDRPLSGREIRSAANGASAMLVMAMDSLDEAAIVALPDDVRLIATLSLGFEHIDLPAAARRGIAVVHAPDVLSVSVAEMAMLHVLAAARRAREGAELMRTRRWTGWSPTQLLGTDLAGRRLGIFGMGRIGRAIAARARAFDMTIHYHNRTRLPSDAEARAVYHATFGDLLAHSDVLVLAAPASPGTAGIFDAAAIDSMPPGAIVVNIARGSLVDDDALIAALRSGRLAAAGLDVFNGEPAFHPGYLDCPTAFLQPHGGSSAWDTRVAMCNALVNEIDAFFAGRPLSTRLV